MRTRHVRDKGECEKDIIMSLSIILKSAILSVLQFTTILTSTGWSELISVVTQTVPRCSEFAHTEHAQSEKYLYPKIFIFKFFIYYFFSKKRINRFSIGIHVNF